MSSIAGKSQEQNDNGEYSKNFTRIPNMLFSSFKYLSKEEKYLYCTFKCIYWDGKHRYVSLRELGELTGYSVGALSKMLPRLHKCGLLSAEIRREKGKDGQEKGNPKYLITILDIWELNRYFHSCSPNERDLLDPSLKLAQEMNELVHENTQTCSPNDTNLFTKTHKPVSFGEQVYAQLERAKDKKDIIKTFPKKERETPPILPITQETNSLSLSQEKSSLLDQLTDEQADFWTRWCAIAGGTQTLNETAHKHVVTLADKVTSTAALQSLYDYAYDRLRELARTTGKEAVPPRLGNLVKAEPEWSQAQNRKQQEKEQGRATHDHIPGSGSVTNWTQARLTGNQPAINYEPLPSAKPASGLSQVGNISAGLQERIRQAREKRTKG